MFPVGGLIYLLSKVRNTPALNINVLLLLCKPVIHEFCETVLFSHLLMELYVPVNDHVVVVDIILILMNKT